MTEAAPVPGSTTHDVESLRRISEEVTPADATPGQRRLIRAAAETVGRGGDARDLARTLRMHPRALVRAAADAGVPPARRLLAWFRVLLAAKVLEERPGLSLDAAASVCGYATGSSLARAFKSLTSRPPQRARPFRAVAAAFEADLARWRASRGSAGVARNPDVP